MNRFATFGDTVWLNGVLNHVMFLCLFHQLFLFTRLYLKSTFSYPLVFSAVSYSTFNAWKISAIEEFLQKLSLVIFSNFFSSCGGWFEYAYCIVRFL